MNFPSFHHKAREVERLLASERRGLLQYACYRLGNPDDAEDAVQDAFLRLHQRLGDGGVEVRDLSAYLYRTLANLCASRQRSPGWRQAVPLEDVPEPAASEPEDFEQEYRRIARLLAGIPDSQAEVIRLRFYGDRSFREIAAILDLPLATVKSRFAYGMEKIRRGMCDPSNGQGG